jgi:hypothetical protein
MNVMLNAKGTAPNDNNERYREGGRQTEKSSRRYKQASPTMSTTRALIIDQTRMHKASRSDLGREALVHGRQSFCGLSVLACRSSLGGTVGDDVSRTCVELMHVAICTRSGRSLRRDPSALRFRRSLTPFGECLQSSRLMQCKSFRLKDPWMRSSHL